MTGAPVTIPDSTAQPAVTLAGRGSDAFARVAGRDLLMAFYGALRAIQLYPPDNPVVQKTLDEVVRLNAEFLRHERELEVRLSGGFIFINTTRLRLDIDTFASFGRIRDVFVKAGVGVIRVREEATPREWMVFLSLLQAPASDDPFETLESILARLTELEIAAFDLGPPSEVDDELLERAKEAAKRTYTQSVHVTKEVINSVRMGRSPNIKRIKRVVQGIVDQILNEEASLMGLTTLRDYDEYTFVHSVNVCIFSVALGRKLGLTRFQLYELGIAALMHDIGKARIPAEVLHKPGSLTDDEWRTMCSHPWLGVLALFGMRGHSDIPYRAMVVAFEHHKKTDLSGYPRHLRPRTMGMFSRIVAVADGFDAATSQRVYQSEPMSPADVLREMRHNPRRGMDQVVVKGFMSLVGHYPVGTVVVLDSFELAIVHSVNPVPEAISRPLVRIVSDDRGNMLFPGHVVDLNERDPDTDAYLRTIIKVTDPERYGIRVGDYFV
ncbi:MAG TPA: HD-GYP domain-containing protein [Gemmatimonadaceae bacterium]|nr:HD-GYP domain-containing protein [Gemmatimonadaceae bacterium]